jgi:hypothetical protein
MDYSELNNLLNNLEVVSPKQNSSINNIDNSKSYIDNKKINTNNLQRDMSLNQNKNNVELSNPQRFSNNKDSNELYEKFDECNNMISNYNFAFSQRTINPNQFIDFTKLNIENNKNKNNINDRINDRGFTPSSTNKFFN